LSEHLAVWYPVFFDEILSVVSGPRYEKSSIPNPGVFGEALDMLLAEGIENTEPTSLFTSSKLSPAATIGVTLETSIRGFVYSSGSGSHSIFST
jgi:hypothetical protein